MQKWAELDIELNFTFVGLAGLDWDNLEDTLSYDFSVSHLHDTLSIFLAESDLVSLNTLLNISEESGFLSGTGIDSTIALDCFKHECAFINTQILEHFY